MRTKDVIRRSLYWGGQFDLYVVTHPEILEEIPDDAQVFVLPNEDPEVCEYNLQLAREIAAKENGPVVFVRFDGFQPAQPPDFINPKVEVVA